MQMTAGAKSVDTPSLNEGFLCVTGISLGTCRRAAWLQAQKKIWSRGVGGVGWWGEETYQWVDAVRKTRTAKWGEVSETKEEKKRTKNGLQKVLKMGAGGVGGGGCICPPWGSKHLRPHTSFAIEGLTWLVLVTDSESLLWRVAPPPRLLTYAPHVSFSLQSVSAMTDQSPSVFRRNPQVLLWIFLFLQGRVCAQLHYNSSNNYYISHQTVKSILSKSVWSVAKREESNTNSNCSKQIFRDFFGQPALWLKCVCVFDTHIIHAYPKNHISCSLTNLRWARSEGSCQIKMEETEPASLRFLLPTAKIKKGIQGQAFIIKSKHERQIQARCAPFTDRRSCCTCWPSSFPFHRLHRLVLPAFRNTSSPSSLALPPHPIWFKHGMWLSVRLRDVHSNMSQRCWVSRNVNLKDVWRILRFVSDTLLSPYGTLLHSSFRPKLNSIPYFKQDILRIPTGLFMTLSTSWLYRWSIIDLSSFLTYIWSVARCQASQTPRSFSLETQSRFHPQLVMVSIYSKKVWTTWKGMDLHTRRDELIERIQMSGTFILIALTYTSVRVGELRFHTEISWRTVLRWYHKHRNQFFWWIPDSYKVSIVFQCAISSWPIQNKIYLSKGVYGRPAHQHTFSRHNGFSSRLKCSWDTWRSECWIRI